jgi:hypothetical protein
MNSFRFLILHPSSSSTGLPQNGPIRTDFNCNLYSPKHPLNKIDSQSFCFSKIVQIVNTEMLIKTLIKNQSLVSSVIYSCSNGNSPESTMTTVADGVPDWDPTASTR